MPVDRTQLDADIATEVADNQAQQALVTTYISDVNALLGSLQAPDFSVEDAQVQAQIAAVTASGAAVQAAIGQLPPPPPGPGAPAKPA